MPPEPELWCMTAWQSRYRHYHTKVPVSSLHDGPCLYLAIAHWSQITWGSLSQLSLWRRSAWDWRAQSALHATTWRQRRACEHAVDRCTDSRGRPDQETSAVSHQAETQLKFERFSWVDTYRHKCAKCGMCEFLTDKIPGSLVVTRLTEACSIAIVCHDFSHPTYSETICVHWDVSQI